MARTPMQPNCRRWTAGVLAVLIGLGPLATPSYAALTALSDQPLSVQNQAKPNIVLTVDDSTSMLFDFLPDSVVVLDQGDPAASPPRPPVYSKYCRDITGNANARCGDPGQNADLTLTNRGKYLSPGYIYQQFNFPYGPAPAPASATWLPSTNPIYSAGGPGAGCDLANAATATCSSGFDPGPLPGIERYPNPAGPPPGKSPKAGLEYEYWTLWPAPAHNSALNHVYYNPRLTYDPPVFADGTSYPQMNAGNTTGWTRVPANPWASSIQYIDLTKNTTVGLWCNSDWSLGKEADPAYCRTNGTGASALSASASSTDGDYNYPWAPPGINPGSGPTIAKSIAWSKVDSATHAIKPAWATAQDPKYFYETDNTLWCDSTSPLWPHQGPLQPQDCVGADVKPQTCNGTINQTCSAGTPQTCTPVTPQTCDGQRTQTCQNLTGQTCSGPTTQVCNGATSQTCTGVGPQTCAGISSQTCSGVTPQTCTGIGSQTCNGVTPQSCNLVAPVCNPPPPTSCTTDWVPDGCNLLPPAEQVNCHLESHCPDGTCSSDGSSCQNASTCPATGTCSSSGSACSGTNPCPTLQGHCSGSGEGCFTAAICPQIGHCSADIAHTCRVNTDCATIAGHCTVDNSACLNDSACSNAGHCTLVGNVCHVNGDCPTQAGQCTGNRNSCFDNSACPPIGGACSVAGNACVDNTQCPAIAGHCNVDNQACSVNTDCGLVGQCSINPTACHANAECPNIAGQCSTSHQACNGSCPTLAGHCTVSNAGCFDNSGCPPIGQNCSITGEACSATPYFPICSLDFVTTCSEPSYCPIQGGTCSVDSSKCQHFFANFPPYFSYDIAYCLNATTPGHCSIDNSTCTPGTCPATQGPSANATCSDLLTSAGAPIVVPNSNFETPFIGDYQYGPGGASWSFAGGSGIQHAFGSFGAGLSGDGTQTAFIQGTGSFSQAINLNPGSYRISFLTARRVYSVPAWTVQPISVSVDGVAIDAAVAPSADYQFHSVSLNFTISTAGSHTITFAGTDGSGDKSSFIDAVQIALGTSLLEDANGAGVVCRHNNKTYGATVAGRYNYPDSRYNTPVTAGTGINACVSSNRYALVPRHYYKTSVEWCDKQIATAGDKWLGYGTPTGGSCKNAQDATHVSPRFYQFGQDPGTDNYALPAFQRIDLDIAKRFTATYTHTWKDDSNTPVTITRSFDGATPDVSEMTNYANWFAYYRTRIQAVKTVTSLAFKELDTKYRVGFHSLATMPPSNPLGPAAHFINIADFTPAQKSAWFAELFSIDIPLGQETPSLSALVRIGQYYKDGTQPQLAGSTDPIQLSCQKNWHMFFTDGYTNQNALPSTKYGNQDDTVLVDYPDKATKPITGLNTGAAFPALYREDPAGSAANSLSDYAMYYWITDLRTAMPNNVPVPPPPLDVYMRDPASWQHQNFAALSLGTSGKLPASNPGVTESQLKAGGLQWPKPFPSVNKPDNSGVDDLWHAAINGRGRFVNAESAEDLKQGIGQILADIANQSGARAGVGFVSNSFGPSANFRYQVSFEPGWSGSVKKVQIVPATGQPIAVNPVQWDAATQLKNQLTIVPSIKDTPWFTERKIVTMNQAGAKVPFLWANLGANQRDSLAPGKPVRGQAVLEFLRGNPLKEGPKVGQLRQRDNPLGDIVDSSPVFVGPPTAAYLDANDPGYAGFKTAFAGRAGRVYVGGNDGMVHAFDDANGLESWAYIPTPLFRGGTATALPPVPNDPKAGLGALSYQDGALPPFRHHFYVDSTPKIVDVDFDAPNGAWHTILVGGLGKGGNRYYALDVTDPAAIVSEAAAASKILWEFPPVGDTTTDMGYSYGKPMIAKLHGLGWAAIVGSGYNNPSGEGKLYFVKASDGSPLKPPMSTGVGSAGTPSGLAHPAGYTQDFRNQLVEQIYSGDLLGNVWRFDVSDASSTNWTSGKFALVVDAVSAPQPVTTPPEIKIDVLNGTDRWVFLGTGKLYDDTDLTTPNPPQQQTMYAFRDGTAAAPWALSAPAIDRYTVGMVPLSHLAALDFGLSTKPDKGWFDDLPVGQRIVVPPQAAIGVIAYIGTSPQTDPCLTGLPVNIYARDYSTGKTLLTANDDGTGAIVETIYDAAGGVGLSIVSFDTPPGTTLPDVRIAITRADGSVRYLKPKLSIPSQHRMSWRLLGQ